MDLASHQFTMLPFLTIMVIFILEHVLVINVKCLRVVRNKRYPASNLTQPQENLVCFILIWIIA